MRISLGRNLEHFLRYLYLGLAWRHREHFQKLRYDWAIPAVTNLRSGPIYILSNGYR